jgi:hypothetical protein
MWNVVPPSSAYVELAGIQQRNQSMERSDKVTGWGSKLEQTNISEEKQ